MNKRIFFFFANENIFEFKEKKIMEKKTVRMLVPSKNIFVLSMLIGSVFHGNIRN